MRLKRLFLMMAMALAGWSLAATLGAATFGDLGNRLEQAKETG